MATEDLVILVFDSVVRLDVHRGAPARSPAYQARACFD